VEGSLVADSARWGLSRRSGGFVPACAWSARRRGTCFTSRAKRHVRACTSAQALSDCFGAQTLEAEDCSGSRLRVRAVEKRSLARCHATWRTLRLQRLAEPTFEPAPVAEPNDCLVPGSVTPPRGGHRPQPLRSGRQRRPRAPVQFQLERTRAFQVERRSTTGSAHQMNDDECCCARQTCTRSDPGHQGPWRDCGAPLKLVRQCIQSLRKAALDIVKPIER